jgi:hypothetical protein
MDNMKERKLNSDKIWKVWKKSRLNSEMIWKIWKKRVKRYEKYVSAYFSSVLSAIQLGFLPCFSYLVTMQLGFLPYFPYHFTIQLAFLKLECEMIWKICKKSKLNSDKIWTI